MRYGYYPGCSLSSTGVEYNMSTKEVAKAFDIDLWELPDWNCCGASSAHLTDHNLAISLPARNLAIAEEAELPLAIPCAACYIRSKAAQKAVLESTEVKERVEYIIGRKYEGKYDIKSLLEIFINDVSLDKVKDKVTRSLDGLKVASYYGCLLVRPSEVTTFDDVEDPMSMDNIVTALGGEATEWAYKVECCGAAHPTAIPEVGGNMVKDILDNAKKNGAEAIVCACPLCFTNLDMRQKKLGEKYGIHYDLPIFYFTELIGITLGLDITGLGLKRHFINPLPLLEKKGLLKPVVKGDKA